MKHSFAVVLATTAAWANALTTNGGPCTMDDLLASQAVSAVWPNCSATATSLLTLLPKDAAQLTTWCASTCMANLAAVIAASPNCIVEGTTTNPSTVYAPFANLCAATVPGGPCNLAQQMSLSTVGVQLAPAKCMAAAGLPATTTIADWFNNFKPAYCSMADCVDGLKTFNASLPNCVINGSAIFPNPCAKVSAATSHLASAAVALACLVAFLF
ncbi:Aste57867_25310 [Aphanomyces stellatus]|uniref:Aste57867_25310 protein n=1 Tax=Aphanomyces stellatus TaxID=120398 RepID=A0A485LSU2_9STRA|nr:hypothetical protein As57867_025232 [Aphanomyces stellatus]VFU01935.1 Aste57867_25310 [Aphanomyces stellatus]